jgi:hypothetical protein
MAFEPTFAQLVLRARLRIKLAHRILDVAWVFWFLMLKGTAAKLYRLARRVAAVPQ